jgi:hypothetical protein
MRQPDEADGWTDDGGIVEGCAHKIDPIGANGDSVNSSAGLSTAFFRASV